ncbi:hypothetical protein, partial [Pseudomonas sp. 30_B]|uniref:hypothetical protein n=1 Tax=Pseudomonas sp. 30_B TaxID=2813575 RepID=UPI001A9E184D
MNIKKFLEPFNQYTKMSCKEAKTTVCEAKMIIEELKCHLNEYTSDSNSTISNVAKEILNEINKRFAFIYDQTSNNFDPIYLTSTYLLPEYKQTLSDDEIAIAKTILKSHSDNS